jgi:hypothetical protein
MPAPLPKWEACANFAGAPAKLALGMNEEYTSGMFPLARIESAVANQPG